MRVWLVAVCCVVLGLGQVAAGATPQLNLIPQVRQVSLQDGSFTLHSGQTIVPADASQRVQWIADYLQQKLAAEDGVQLHVAKRATDGGVTLRLDDSITKKGAYKLDVSAAGVVISAGTEQGLLWGVQTLRQLAQPAKDSAVTLPAVQIEDSPSYTWRSVMLDTGRHFYPVSFIEGLLDSMSAYKFNVFHWHLTEDQGWRFASAKYPKLTSVGAWRTEPDGSRYGGFYTTAQMREIVQYAQDRGIMVVPEIEMPGHSTAAIAAYPELSCNKQPLAVATTWGVLHNAFCAGDPKVYRFLENVLDEVAGVFPSKYIHIGGDEVPADVWADCKRCAKLAADQGFSDDEMGLHGYFVGKIQKYLASKGKTMVGWDEILEGGLSPNAVVEVWHLPGGVYGGSDKVMREALANGNRVIIAGPYYLDMPVNTMTVEDIYRSDPFANPDLQSHPDQVLGGDAPLWSEHATPLNGMARLFPRLMAVSEQMWGTSNSNVADFMRREKVRAAAMHAHGVRIGPANQNIVDYRIFHSERYHRWRILATTGFADTTLRYTLDGSAPTASSAHFRDVLDLYQPATVMVAPFRDGIQQQAAEQFPIVANLAADRPVTATNAPVRGTLDQLTDGFLGSPDPSRNDVRQAQRWLAWPVSGMDATVDLGHVEPVKSVALRFLRFAGRAALLPRSVQVQVSRDGQQWQTLGQQDVTDNPKDFWVIGSQRVVTSVAAPDGIQARYIRVQAVGAQTPQHGINGRVWTDEIVVH